MIIRNTVIALALAGAGFLIGLPVLAQTGEDPIPVATPSTPAKKLAAQYSVLAGSEKNAESLIVGLRDGKQVLLLATPDSTAPEAASVTFMPVKGKLGYGNVNIALSLAQADLAKQGITAPTPEQLAAVLNGGQVVNDAGVTVTFAGILAQRQSGMGWGAIANAMGVKLGAVVSVSKNNKSLSEFKATNAQKSKNVATTTTSTERGKSTQSNGNSENNGGGNSGGKGGGGGNSGGGGGGGNSGGGGGRGK